MDPNSGRLYASLDAARLAGVENPVHITGRLEDIKRISDAVAEVHRREMTAAEREAKRARNKAAKKARRNNR